MDATKNYPVARWYLRPAADRLADWLTPTRIRPIHLTLCGLACAATAAGVLLWRPELSLVAAACVLGWWFCDRADGMLARRQGTVSAFGAWLDGNVDELVDVGLHVAIAAVLSQQVAAAWPWWLLAAFLGGKYLLMYGLNFEEHAADPQQCGLEKGDRYILPERPEGCFAQNVPVPFFQTSSHQETGLLRHVYHLPGNADVRAHVLVVLLAAGWLAAALAYVAVYYNVRWMARYVLVARRMGGSP